MLALGRLGRLADTLGHLMRRVGDGDGQHGDDARSHRRVQRRQHRVGHLHVAAQHNASQLRVLQEVLVRFAGHGADVAAG